VWHRSAIVEEAAALIRERTADGEPLYYKDGGTVTGRCQKVWLVPSDLKMLRRRSRYRQYMDEMNGLFAEDVARLLRAQSPDRGRLVTTSGPP
jgi:hypothetical protein